MMLEENIFETVVQMMQMALHKKVINTFETLIIPNIECIILHGGFWPNFSPDSAQF